MNQDEPATDAGRRFGEAVRDARGIAGISQRKLSELVMEKTGTKLYPSAVTRIETGQREPRLSEAVAIAQALGMSLGELVDSPADYATRFDQAINNLPVRLHETSEALKYLAAQFIVIARLLDQHPDLLAKMRFAGDRQPRDVRGYLALVAEGFRENATRRRSKASDTDFREPVIDILVALASSTVPADDAEA